jgi:hypothetical protein
MAQVTNLYASTPVGLRSKYSRPIAAFTRPADIVTYGANDVVSDSSATAKCLIFLDAGGQGIVQNATLSFHDVQNIDFELWLFQSEPTNFVDNAALALVNSDMRHCIGTFVFNYLNRRPANATGSHNIYRADLGVSVTGTGLQTVDQGLAFHSASGALFGLLVTRTGFTPVASTRFDLSLSVVRGVS